MTEILRKMYFCYSLFNKYLIKDLNVRYNARHENSKAYNTTLCKDNADNRTVTSPIKRSEDSEKLSGKKPREKGCSQGS